LYGILKHDIREKGHGSLLRVLSYHKILCITGTNQPLPPEEVSKWDNIIYENFSRQIPDYILKEYQPYEKDQGITQMIFEKPFDDICSFFENLVKINPDFKEYFRPQEPAAPVPKPSKPLTKTVARPNVLSTSEREFQDMAQKAAIPSKPKQSGPQKSGDRAATSAKVLRPSHKATVAVAPAIKASIADDLALIRRALNQPIQADLQHAYRRPINHKVPPAPQPALVSPAPLRHPPTRGRILFLICAWIWFVPLPISLLPFIGLGWLGAVLGAGGSALLGYLFWPWRHRTW